MLGLVHDSVEIAHVAMSMNETLGMNGRKQSKQQRMLGGLLSFLEELLNRMSVNASELVAQRLNHHDLPQVIGGHHATNFCLMGPFINLAYLVSYREIITRTV
mgnify:CR=1 FL=1